MPSNPHQTREVSFDEFNAWLKDQPFTLVRANIRRAARGGDAALILAQIVYMYGLRDQDDWRRWFSPGQWGLIFDDRLVNNLKDRTGVPVKGVQKAIDKLVERKLIETRNTTVKGEQLTSLRPDGEHLARMCK